MKASLLGPATAGFAFHLGSNKQPAMVSEAARTSNKPSQPNRSWRKPGREPPAMAPSDPAPLIKPAAVEAPFLVPKSTAAVPLNTQSGTYSNTPITTKQP